MPELEDLERRIKCIEEKLGIVDNYPYDFKDLVSNLDNRTLEQMWQGMDTREITIPLIGLTQEQLLQIKPTLSKTRWNEIKNELSAPFTQETTESTIQYFREKFLDRILKMERQGEIVVARGEWKDYVPNDPTIKKEEPLFDVQSWLHSTFEKA
jgi:flagellar motor switch protein FliG